MYSLLIETSTKKPTIAINKNDISIISKSFFNKKDFSNIIFPTIKNLLLELKISISDIGFISVGIGPGYFTGIRVGASIAKSISFSLNIPIASFCSLKSFIPKNDGKFLSIIDAKSKKVFTLKGEKNNNSITYLSEAKIILIDDLYNYKDHTIVSPSINLIKENVLQNIHDSDVNTNHLARISFKKFVNKNFTLSDRLKILYLKEPNHLAL